MTLQLRGAIGRPSDVGMPAPNYMIDQQLVIELLDVGWHPPLLPLSQNLPAIEEGEASEQLCNEIARFQQDMGLDIADGRVSVGSSTWNALTERAETSLRSPGPAPLVLSIDDYEVRTAEARLRIAEHHLHNRG